MMFFKHDYKYYDDKLLNGESIIKFVLPESAIKFTEHHGEYLNDALYHFMVYALAIKDSQQPKTIEAGIFTKDYNEISLKTFRQFYSYLSKQQSKLYYELGVKCFVEGFYVDNSEFASVFNDTIALMGIDGEVSNKQTASIEINLDDSCIDTHLFISISLYENKIFVQIIDSKDILDIEQMKSTTISLLESQEEG
jgi:hypothetical protein